MTDARVLSERNARFLAERLEPGLSINPHGGTRTIDCMDTRVDPTPLSRDKNPPDLES